MLNLDVIELLIIFPPPLGYTKPHRSDVSIKMIIQIVLKELSPELLHQILQICSFNIWLYLHVLYRSFPWICINCGFMLAPAVVTIAQSTKMLVMSMIVTNAIIT